MSDRSIAERRRSLEALIKDFQNHADRFPDLRHCLVDLTRERSTEISAEDLASRALEGRDLVQGFFDPGYTAREPNMGQLPRTHYYFGSRRKSFGEAVEEFRRLGRQAARIVDGWSYEELGLPSTLSYPIRLTRDREADAWMTIVHRLAWDRERGQPLHADVSVPQDYDPLEKWRSLPAGHPLYQYVLAAQVGSSREAEPFHDDAIPPDCIISRLSDDPIGSACIWAIEMIGRRIEHPEKDCRHQPGWFPGLIKIVDEILRYSRELYENAGSTHFFRKTPELGTVLSGWAS